MAKTVNEDISLKVKAGIPIIQLISYEWRRVMGFCIRAQKENSRSLYTWNNTAGISKYNEYDEVWEPENADILEPSGALAWFEHDCSENSIFLMEDLHLYFDAGNYREIFGYLRKMAKNNDGLDNKKTLVLSQPVRYLPAELEKDVYVIDIDLPEKKILSSVLDEVVDYLEIEGSCPQRSRDRLAEAARGLTTIEAKNVFCEIALDKGRLTEDEIPLVIGEKEQVIKKSGILEYFHPSESFSDIGGMESLIEWLRKRRRGFDSDATEFGMTPPKGVLLLGVQGCGKSLLAKSIASDWNLPLLRFDLGRVFGGIVGESENNIRRALDTAKAISPSILWIDEIEKGLSGVGSSGDTDGGTTARVFGTLLTWMQEKKEPVFVVATANDISSLPPELLRKGRFDEIFFVDLPGEKSRRDIWSIHLKKRLGVRYTDGMFDFEKLVEKSRGFSGAEIEEAVNEGLYQAYYDGRELQTDDLLHAIDETVPLSWVMGKSIQCLREFARSRARLASDEEQEEITTENVVQTAQEKRKCRAIFEE